MPTLLLVEDDLSNRLTLAALLEEVGYEVSEAATFEEAQQVLRAHSFDAVVLDRGMGERDGVDLAPLARASHPPTRIVVLSGSELRPGAASAVDAWLVKGRDFKELLKALRPLSP